MIVVFDPTAFKVRYPEFSAVSNLRCTESFNDAELYLSNTDGSPVQDINRRTRLLWMLTAHLLFIGGVLNPGGIPSPVGRISSATEGSVSISTEWMTMTPGSGAWFNQTGYGSSFWAATTSLRGFRYIAQPTVY